MKMQHPMTPHHPVCQPKQCITACCSVLLFRKRTTNYRALLRKMTYEDKASYGSSPTCRSTEAVYYSVLQRVAACCSVSLNTHWHSFSSTLGQPKQCITACCKCVASVLQVCRSVSLNTHWHYFRVYLSSMLGHPNLGHMVTRRLVSPVGSLWCGISTSEVCCSVV